MERKNDPAQLGYLPPQNTPDNQYCLPSVPLGKRGFAAFE